ncbi:sodium:solute symporter family protein [Dethiobacter alkaliphilus]|uniref:sodium:solute symporter family protein n=1 Tax=Dethiobacter alkaliphilus TaxID=427926 RepID=UPI002226CEB0|nr:cation acetate symporter [Dethiobacter alkaliphilus]MCW3488782.1 cation acetate symporter [Dethiobacter alkaliphilus]
MEANPVVIFAAFVYFAVIVAIGYSTRKASADPMDYYVAGRKIGPVVNGAALSAAYFSPASFLGMPAFIFLMGYPFWWVLSAIIAGLPLATMLTAAPMRKYAPVSFTDYFADRFDSPKLMRVLAGIPTIMSGWAYIVLSIVGTGLFMMAILRIDYTYAIILGALIIMFYVWMGGMVATTFSSAFQGVLITLASVVVAFVVLNLYGGFSGLGEAVYANNPNFWLMPGADPGGAFSHPIMSYWTGAVGFYFVWHFGFSTMPYTVVRFFTTMDIKSARRSVLWAVIFGGPMYWGLLIAGTAARVTLENLHPMMDAGATNAVEVLAMIQETFGIGGAAMTDYSYIALVEALNQPWVLGILVAGGLAISMATAAAWVMVLNVLFGRDFMGKVMGNTWAINNPVKSLRIWTIIIMFVCTLFAFNPAAMVLDLSGWAFIVIICTTGVPLVAGIWWERANTTATIATICVFFPLSLFTWLYAKEVLGSPHWFFASQWIWGEGGFMLPTGHQVWLVPASVIFYIVVALLTKPNRPEVIEQYCNDLH